METHKWPQQQAKTSTEWSGNSRRRRTGLEEQLCFVSRNIVIQETVKIGTIANCVAAQTFSHASQQVLATVHGSDFIAAGDVQALDQLDEMGSVLHVQEIAPSRTSRVGRHKRRHFTKSRKLD